MNIKSTSSLLEVEVSEAFGECELSVILPFPVLIQLGVLPRVLIVHPVLQVVRVEAAVHERTEALAAVEVLAGDGLEDLSVLLHQIVLLRPALNDVVRRHYQVAVPTTDRARAVVVLRRTLVKGRTPSTDATQTECVVAVVQHTELAPICQNLFETDAALFIKCIPTSLRLVLILFNLFQFFFRWMVEPARVPVAAVAPLEVLACCEPVLVLQEQIDNLLVVLHLLKLCLRYAAEYLLLLVSFLLLLFQETES